MTRTTLIEALAYECGLTKKESKTIIETVFKLMSDSLIRGEDVTITDFASFRIRPLPNRKYKHSTTGELMEIWPDKRIKAKIADAIIRKIDPGI